MSSVLGIDLSSFAVDLVKLDETTLHADWRRVTLTGETAFDRLRSVREEWPDSDYFQDCYLSAIEIPWGMRQPGSQAKLNRVFGAITALLPRDLQLWDVLPKAWRAELGLKPSASKNECGTAVVNLCLQATDVAMTHALIWPQDALDAYAVAYYARSVNERALRATETAA